MYLRPNCKTKPPSPKGHQEAQKTTANANHRAPKVTKKHKRPQQTQTTKTPRTQRGTKKTLQRHPLIMSSCHLVILSSSDPSPPHLVIKPSSALSAPQAPIHQPSTRQQPEQWLQRSTALYQKPLIRNQSLYPQCQLVER